LIAITGQLRRFLQRSAVAGRDGTAGDHGALRITLQ